MRARENLDVRLDVLRVGDRILAGGAGRHREELLVEQVVVDVEGRIRYFARCRGSHGRLKSWLGAPDEKRFLVERGPGVTYEEMDEGIRFEQDGRVALSESGRIVPEAVYEAYLRRQPRVNEAFS